MIKLLLIGAGFMGKTHARIYKNLDRVSLVGIVDASMEAARAFAGEFDCAYFTDFATALGDIEFDAVDICLPTFLHEEYLIAASNAKKDIICEKPITLDLPCLDRSLQSIRKNGVRLFVAQVLRFWPEYVRIKEMFEAKELGEIKFIDASRLSEHPSWSMWYRKPEYSGGGLLDLHLHDIDYLIYLLGRVRSVYAVGEQNEDGAWNYVTTILRFESGISACAHGVIEMEQGYPFTVQFRLVGTKKTVEHTMRAGANLEDMQSALRQTWVIDDGNIEEWGAGQADAYALELEHFVDCIQNKKESDIIPVESVRDVLCTMEAIKASLQSGKEELVSYKEVCE